MSPVTETTLSLAGGATRWKVVVLEVPIAPPPHGEPELREPTESNEGIEDVAVRLVRPLTVSQAAEAVVSMVNAVEDGALTDAVWG